MWTVELKFSSNQQSEIHNERVDADALATNEVSIAVADDESCR
jgi:hypothetical protein